MAEFTQFEASVPLVKPPTSEVVYDKYWMKRMSVNAENPSRPVEMTAVFIPARDVVVESNVNGEITTTSYKEVMADGPEKVLRVEDLFELAATDMSVAITMDSVFALLKRIAVERNIL